MTGAERIEYRTFLAVLAGWVTVTAAIGAGLYQIDWIVAAIWVWVCLSVFGYVLHTRLPLRPDTPVAPPGGAYAGDPLADASDR